MIEVHTYKPLLTNLIKTPGLITNYQEIKGRKEHVKHCWVEAICKIRTWGELQNQNHKKEKVEVEPVN